MSEKWLTSMKVNDYGGLINRENGNPEGDKSRLYSAADK